MTFANKDEAQLAIDALNETELDGRTIRVSAFFLFATTPLYPSPSLSLLSCFISSFLSPVG